MPLSSARVTALCTVLFPHSQLAAVRSAINGTCEVILKDHLEHCIVNAVTVGDTEALEKLKRAVELLMK